MNRQITLAARPVGMPTESDFSLVESPIPHPARGEVLVQALYLSVDPSVRGRLTGVTTYARGLDLGEVIVGGVVGRVLDSSDPRYGPDDIVEGMLGWQEYAVAPAKSLRKIDSSNGPISSALYVLGMPGLTAYFGLLDIGKPKEGETVVVSGAAGAVGSVAGQIGKIIGCRVVGIAGGPEKCAWITDELGFDAWIDYKSEDVAARLRETCPDGIDVFFDNVGGEILDAVLGQINLHARIALCGAISQYDKAELSPGPRNFLNLIPQRGRVEGFILLDYRDRFVDAILQLGQWVQEGRIRYAEDIVEGLENAPAAFRRLFSGENTGKLIVKVAE